MPEQAIPYHARTGQGFSGTSPHSESTGAAALPGGVCRRSPGRDLAAPVSQAPARRGRAGLGERWNLILSRPVGSSKRQPPHNIKTTISLSNWTTVMWATGACSVRTSSDVLGLELFIHPANPAGADQAVFAHTMMAPASSWEEEA